MLRPGTDESLTGSPSFIKGKPKDVERDETALSIDISEFTASRRRRIWLLTPILLILAAAITWIALSASDEEQTSGQDGGATGPAVAGSLDASLPKEEATPAVTPASLRITSDPLACRVRIGDKELNGSTPVFVPELTPGVKHRVTVVCKDHKPQEKSVQAEPGEKLTLHFEPDSTRVSVPTGRLKLRTKPWSIVYFGKRKLGMTPLANVKLPAGRHRLIAVNKEKGIRKSFYVTIRAGKTTTVRKKLMP